MTGHTISADDELLARLHAPPELRQGVESLAYWRERRQRLSWYRIRARREASRMILTWERHVRESVLSQRGVPIEVRLSAGLLLGQVLWRRWSRRAAAAIAATLVMAFVVAPVVAIAVLLSHLV